MNEQDLIHIREFVAAAKKSIKFYHNDRLSAPLTESFLRLLEKRICVDIFINPNVSLKTKNDPFYLYKLIGLTKSGGNLYSGSQFEVSHCILCLRDYTEVLRINTESHKIELLTPDLDDFDSVFSLFDMAHFSLDQLHQENGDIAIDFSSDEKIHLKNSTVHFRWNVQNATSVEIDGIGAVDYSGYNQFTILQDQIINIYASNENSLNIKSLYFAVAEAPQIYYDIQFLNPSSKQFVSLPEESGKGVFGVSKGHKVRVVWEIKNAQSCRIQPFDSAEFQGQEEFFVEGTFRLKISAELQGMNESKRIIIQEFPAPIFTQSMIHIEPGFLQNRLIEVSDRRHGALEFLQEKRVLCEENLIELQNRVDRASEQFEQCFQSLLFEDFYKKHSVIRINNSIFERVTDYFRNDSSIVEVVKSMQRYYE